jgi:signal transduction histidine kinase
VRSAGARQDDRVPRWISEQRLRAVGAFLVATVTGWVALGLFAGLVLGLLLVPVAGVGLPVVAWLLTATRRLADRQRRRAAVLLGRPVDGVYAAQPGWTPAQFEASVRDRQTRRDLRWLAGHGLVGAGLSMLLLLPVVLTVNLVAVGSTLPMVPPLVLVAGIWWGAPWVERRLANLAGAWLGPDADTLARRVTELTESRAATVDASAAELRRIERDLHDGAQARLAAFGINLGLARQLLRSDPDEAERLIVASQADARRAQAELRELVRGIHPPVLADRGLPGALEAAALLCPVPVEVTVDLPGRPELPVESAVYFAAAEALTNVGRHSGAVRAWLRAGWTHGVLRVVVGDDGRGGADARQGTGLRGIQRRLAAFDGTVTVHSPLGGPTEICLEVPCASSSPRTTSSSATA